MNRLAYPLMLLAGAGFLASFTAHILALFGITMPGGSSVWVLHVGIFVVWLPAILFMKRKTLMFNSKNQWKALLVGCPIWMNRTVKLLFAYCILNFLLCMDSTPRHSKLTGAAPPAVIRAFSGHWMMFSGFAFVSFYSAVKSSPGRPRVKSSK